MSAAETAPLTTMASAIFFGSILFAAVSLSVKSVVCGDFRKIWQASQNPRSKAVDWKSFISIYTLLVHTSIMGFIMLYAYLCEYHPPYPHAGKAYDRDEFFFLTALLILVSLFTMKAHVRESQPDKQKSVDTDSTDKNNDGQVHVSIRENSLASYMTERAVAPIDNETEVLNRDQTEEWKGWMQFMFLLYHYYHAEETYNAIRIMITCYVWMTGFGNFSFFYLKGDYSSIRVMQMLWRLNFLVAFLCLTQGTTYILYYICLLHTFFFLMVYFTMRVYQHVNYTKYGVRIKLMVLALIIFFVWDVDTGLFRLLHYPFLGEKPVLGATSGPMWEWYFRSTLDHWSTYFGMLFALNFPITSLFFRKLEAQPLHIHIASKSIVAIVFILASYWWVMGPFMQEKFDYNQTNAYFGWIPLITYIYLRNITPWLRAHTLELLHQIGKTTLETYLMQHHIWLTSDAKSLLTLIPGWPKMNFLLVSVIYVVLSRRLYQLTLFLRGMILPNDRTACLNNLLRMCGAILLCIFLAIILNVLNILNLRSVGLFSVLLGGLLYKLVVDQTIDSAASLPRSTAHTVGFLSTGAVAVLLVGLVWNHMAVIGAGKIKPLPPACESYIQQGKWIPLDTCNEGSLGTSFRDYGVAQLGTCPPQTNTYSWGWEIAPSASQCRVVQRDSKSLQQTLKHRNVEFIGDSIIRHLYHAACRQLGDKSAGAYNTTIAKWTDFSKTYKTTTVDFKWAPFVYDLTSRLQTLRGAAVKPDVVVMGGGAWDRLNNYETLQQQQLFDQNVTHLMEEINSLRSSGVPVVWLTPTTINSWALSEQKRANIREDQMSALRQLYEAKGVLGAASLVLDGPTFTADRVAESYDGVHYPFSVYDAGSQILANAFDWLLPEKDTSDPFKAPRPGLMANPYLGLMMLFFVSVSLFLFDGFMGASYLVGLFAPSAIPPNLYLESFSLLHQQMGLPELETADNSLEGSSIKSKSSDRFHDADSDDERESFMKSVEIPKIEVDSRVL